MNKRTLTKIGDGPETGDQYERTWPGCRGLLILPREEMPLELLTIMRDKIGVAINLKNF